MGEILYGFGHPLLDILASVNVELLKKYSLKENSFLLAEEKHLPLYDELVKNYEVQYVPGGASQNTIKVAQWILQRKHACIYSGCIKDDYYGKILKESCENIGVKTLYEYNKGPESTGVCASLITGQNRSMVTNLGSADKFAAKFIDTIDVQNYIQQSKIFYISSFFIKSSHDSVLKIASHSVDNNKIFCLNLGAEFLVEFFNAQVVEAIEYSDFVFGNEAEALKLSQTCNFNTDVISEIAMRISKMPFKKSGAYRTVVITQGADPIIIVDKGKIVTFDPPKLSPELVVDTTGAGDAFVGGFLAQLLNGKSLNECVRCGIWASQVIIQRLGCTFPNECLFS